MSVPSVIRLILVSAVEGVESYILSLVNHFYKPRHSTLIILSNDNKAVLPALDGRVRNVSASTYKYELSFGRSIG